MQADRRTVSQTGNWLTDGGIYKQPTRKEFIQEHSNRQYLHRTHKIFPRIWYCIGVIPESHALGVGVKLPPGSIKPFDNLCAKVVNSMRRFMQKDVLLVVSVHAGKHKQTIKKQTVTCPLGSICPRWGTPTDNQKTVTCPLGSICPRWETPTDNQKTDSYMSSL